MDIFDQEARWPSRSLLQEEEEQALPTAHLNLDPPVILWHRQNVEKTYGDSVKPHILIIATTRPSCALLNQACQSKQMLGTVMMPDVSLSGNRVVPSAEDNTCFLYSADSSGRVMLCCCQYAVPAQRAAAWTRGLLAAVPAKHVLVLGSMQAQQFRGPDPSQQTLVYLLQSSAAKAAWAAGQALPLPYLPTSNIITGLPAAIVSHCQLRGLSAEVVVTVHMVPHLESDQLHDLARAAAGLIKHAGHDELAQQLSQRPLLDAVSKELYRAYIAPSNVYI